MTTTPAARATPLRKANTGWLYLVRAVISIIWAGLLVAAVSSGGSLTPEQTIPAFAVALLISYPLIDVIASLIDARSSLHGAPRNAAAQYINAAISAVAAGAVAVAAGDGADAVLLVFGAWALLTGLIQLILAIARRRRGNPGQLPTGVELDGLADARAGNLEADLLEAAAGPSGSADCARSRSLRAGSP